MTSPERRLAAVEEDLGPAALVLRWLSEAHAYDDLASCVRAAIDGAMGGPPMDRLVGEAREGALKRRRGRTRQDGEDLVRRAMVATAFRFQLVLRINVMAHEALDREALIHASLTAYMALAMEATSADRAVAPVDQLRDLLLRRVFELHALEEARGRVEDRYLQGTPALFPALQRAWDEQREQSEQSAVMAIRIAELDGFEEPPPDDVDAFEARVEQLVADHVEPARSTAYNEIGDGRRAYAIATAWARSKW